MSHTCINPWLPEHERAYRYQIAIPADAKFKRCCVTISWDTPAQLRQQYINEAIERTCKTLNVDPNTIPEYRVL